MERDTAPEEAVVLAMPTDRPRPAALSARREVHRFTADAALTHVVQQHDSSASPFDVLFAAWVALLSRYSGQDDICVVVPAPRGDTDPTEALAATGSDGAVLRTRLEGGMTFGQLKARVTAARGAARLVPLPTAATTGPDWPVSFALHLHGDNTCTDLAGHELALSVTKAGVTLAAQITYAPELFDASTVQQLGRSLVHLLAAAAEVPEMPVVDLPLLDIEERRRILDDWNPDTVPDLGPLVHRRVLAHAAQTPSAPAVRCSGETLAFGDLDHRSAALARLLVGAGIGRGATVAVTAPRSLTSAIAILGIWRAGAAYLPIDPDHPEAFRAQVLDAARPALVLGPGDLEPGPGDTWTVDGAIDAGLGPGDLACVMPTSGSTGISKLVAVTHGQLARRLSWGARAFPYAPDDVACHRTPLGFLPSLAELLGPLAAGRPVVVLMDEEVRDPHLMVSVLGAEGVTRIVVVPSVVDHLLRTIEDLGSRLPRLRLWCAGGEPLAVDLARRFGVAVPGARLTNQYGATELYDAAVFVLSSEEAAEARGDGALPIGRPVDYCRAYVLDDRMEPVPLGMIGHLHVATASESWGYLGQPATTAGAYVPDPFSTTPGTRLYRTGDLARWRHDGVLEDCGRADGQVKVHGVRIESGAVAAAASRHPHVTEVHVVAVTDTLGRARLVAHVELEGGVAMGRSPEAVSRDVRQFLTTQLPAVMVPDVVAHDRLPRLPNGKVDRRALTAIGLPRRPASPADAPRTYAEAVIASIWADVLGTPVGVHDDFFTLGGDSLLAGRVIARVRDELAVDLPIESLLEAPTVAGLALAAARDDLDALADSVAAMTEDEAVAMLEHLEPGQ